MNKEIFRTAPKSAKIMFMILGVMIYLTAVSFIIFLLWNYVLVKVTPLKTVTYWQAMGILALFKLLFGFRMFSGKDRRHKFRKQKWKEKWGEMSEEDRLQLKARWKAHCEKKKK